MSTKTFLIQPRPFEAVIPMYTETAITTFYDKSIK